MKSLPLHLSSFITLLLTPGFALAELHVYEGFDYPPGPMLSELDGGEGWDTAWDFLEYASPIVADSLVYSDEQGNTLLTSGGKLFNVGNGASNDSSQPGRTMAMHFGEDGTSVWLAFLGQRVGEKNGDAGEDGAPTYVRGANIALFDTTTAQELGQDFPGQERLDIGENSNTPDDAWMLRAPSTTAPHPETGTVTEISDRPIDQLSLIVLRFDFVANTEEALTNDRVSMWVNPPLGEEPSEADAAVQILDQKEFAFDRLRFFAGGNNGNEPAEWYVDEIRIGDTFSDVTPFTPAVVGEPHLFFPASNPFGSLPLGAGLQTRSITLTNIGETTDLTIASASLSGADVAHFAIMGDFPVTLAPGENHDIEVTFDPQGGDGEFVASLFLMSNDENEPERTLELNASVPDPNQLMAWYKMDDSGGAEELVDSSGNGRHGQYFGTVEAGVEGLAGGTAVHFTNGGYAEIARFPSLETFTLSLWIHGDAPMADPAGLLSKGQFSGDPYALGLAGGQVIWFGAGKTDFEGNDNTALVPNETFHIVSIYDRNDGSPQVLLYIDGALAHTIETPSMFEDSATILQIGAVGGDFPFQGIIDDVQIYGKALSADEVAELHANPGTKLGGGMDGPGEVKPLAIHQIVLNDGALEMTFPTEPGVLYEIQESDDLQSWTPQSEVTAEIDVTTATAVVAALARQFFRVARK